MHVNLSIQDNLFESARRYGVKRVVFYGSSCMYPRDCAQPIKEDRLLTGPIETTSEAYAAAKIAGTVACRAYNAQMRENRFIALVPNSIYGPNDNFDAESSHVLAALIRRFHQAKIEGSPEVTLWGSGTPRREFLFSSDAARASIFAIENAERLSNRHYNVGTGTDCSIKELAGTIASTVGYEGKMVWDTAKPDGTPRKLLDSSDFRSLGWEPVVGLREGIEMTYEWFLMNELDRSA
jgi:GDP-L-fucose synthase